MTAPPLPPPPPGVLPTDWLHDYHERLGLMGVLGAPSPAQHAAALGCLQGRSSTTPAPPAAPWAGWLQPPS